ncbi:MAG: CvpA family protein [Christensenellaceae bacterium]|nr:CvpA family protein [Christensenellaceae bacterium]
MNLIDLAVIAVFALFVLLGFYRGFISTLLNLGAYVLSAVLGLLLMPLCAHAVKSSASLYNMMLYYTEGSEYIVNAEYVRAGISSIGSTDLSGIISAAGLPYPMGKRITANIAKEAFAGQGVVSLGDYFNQTIVCVFINILMFLLVFLAVRLLLGFIINGADYAYTFPVLRSGDSVLGAGLGLLRGMFALFLLFMLLPILLTSLGQFEQIHTMVNESVFAGFFYRSNFLLGLIPGT